MIFSTVPLLMAAVFGALWWMRRARPAAVAAVLWLLYAGYEDLMTARALCSGECNVRVDLLLIWPALALAGAVAVVAAFRRR